MSGLPQCFRVIHQLSRVSRRLLTADGGTWARRTPSLVCSAGGCSSGFFAHRINMLTWRQMQTFCSRYLQMQHRVSEHNPVYNFIPLSKAVEQTQTRPPSQTHTHRIISMFYTHKCNILHSKGDYFCPVGQIFMCISEAISLYIYTFYWKQLIDE